MKKQMMKSLVAVVSVAALSLGIFPGGGSRGAWSCNRK